MNMTPKADTVPSALLDVLLRDPVDEEIAVEFSRLIDDATFALVLRMHLKQEAGGVVLRPAEIKLVARCCGCEPCVVLAMMGYLESPLTGRHHRVLEEDRPLLALDPRRRDVMRALYVWRSCLPDQDRDAEIVGVELTDQFNGNEPLAVSPASAITAMKHTQPASLH